MKKRSDSILLIFLFVVIIIAGIGALYYINHLGSLQSIFPSATSSAQTTTGLAPTQKTTAQSTSVYTTLPSNQSYLPPGYKPTTLPNGKQGYEVYGQLYYINGTPYGPAPKTIPTSTSSTVPTTQSTTVQSSTTLSTTMPTTSISTTVTTSTQTTTIPTQHSPSGTVHYNSNNNVFQIQINVNGQIKYLNASSPDITLPSGQYRINETMASPTGIFVNYSTTNYVSVENPSKPNTTMYVEGDGTISINSCINGKYCS